MSPTTEGRTILVQTCHLPNFFFAAEKLREARPERPLEALVADGPQIRYFLKLFPWFSRVHFFDPAGNGPPSLGEEEAINLVAPLLGKGYPRIKLALLAIPGARLWECDYSGELKVLSRLRLFRSWLQPIHQPTEEFARYIERFPRRPRVLLVPSADRALIDRCRPVWEKHFPADTEIVELKDPSHQKGEKGSFEAAIIFLSGRSGFFHLQRLPFLWRIPTILAINENAEPFEATPGSLSRFFWSRIRHGYPPLKRRRRVLFIETETPPHVEAALDKIKQPELLPEAEIVLLCSRKSKKRLSRHPQVDMVLEFARRPADQLKLWRQIQALAPDVVSGIFSGRPIYRGAKLLYLLLSTRRQLAFNARLDCYWVTPAALYRMFRQEPVLFPEQEEGWRGSVTGALPEDMADLAEILLIQTEDEQETAAAARHLLSGKLTGKGRVAILCNRDSESVFSDIPGIERVYTYRPRDLVGNLELLFILWKTPRDVVAATFSGRAIFRLQKLLFFLLPARNRLVFNEARDCFYMKRRHSTRLLRFSLNVRDRGFSWGWLRLCAKPLLFGPRLLYLLLWLTIEKLKRARILQDQS